MADVCSDGVVVRQEPLPQEASTKKCSTGIDDGYVTTTPTSPSQATPSQETPTAQTAKRAQIRPCLGTLVRLLRHLWNVVQSGRADLLVPEDRHDADVPLPRDVLPDSDAPARSVLETESDRVRIGSYASEPTNMTADVMLSANPTTRSGLSRDWRIDR